MTTHPRTPPGAALQISALLSAGCGCGARPDAPESEDRRSAHGVAMADETEDLFERVEAFFEEHLAGGGS